MQRACDIGKKNKLDPALRRYVLWTGAVCSVISLVAGFYAGFAFISNDAALGAPLSDKIFLNIFIAISCGAAGLIFGAFVGSTVYRIKEKK
jgi:hypothetical protein